LSDRVILPWISDGVSRFQRFPEAYQPQHLTGWRKSLKNLNALNMH